MDWAYLAALMADIGDVAATTPALVFVSGLVIFSAGMLCGVLARGFWLEHPETDARDTPANPPRWSDAVPTNRWSDTPSCQCRTVPLGTTGHLQQVDSRGCPLHRLTCSPTPPAARRGS
jgi:hypothetical protein